ncbi:MAG: DinB family protein [Rhodothermales bacterium]|nr:DinB family protein [Rhodothermales bacterium]
MKWYLLPVLCLLVFGSTGCTTDNPETDQSENYNETVPPSMADLASLTAHRAEFMATLEGLTDEQLNFREAEDRWSILEIAEHIVKADEATAMALAAMVEAGPNPEIAPDSSLTAMQISMMMSDRSQKFQAPDEFVPEGRFTSAEDAMAAFDANHQVFKDASMSDHDLGSHYMPHPAIGVINASNWIAFSTAHGQRHIDQMVQVKTHDAYPSASS